MERGSTIAGGLQPFLRACAVPHLKSRARLLPASSSLALAPHQSRLNSRQDPRHRGSRGLRPHSGLPGRPGLLSCSLRHQRSNRQELELTHKSQSTQTCCENKALLLPAPAKTGRGTCRPRHLKSSRGARGRLQVLLVSTRCLQMSSTGITGQLGFVS